MVKRFQCIAKDLEFYFTSYGEVKEFLTPFNYEAMEICLRPSQCSALSLSSFLGPSASQVPRAELITLLVHITLAFDMGFCTVPCLFHCILFLFYFIFPLQPWSPHPFLPPHRRQSTLMDLADVLRYLCGLITYAVLYVCVCVNSHKGYCDVTFFIQHYVLWPILSFYVYLIYSFLLPYNIP